MTPPQKLSPERLAEIQDTYSPAIHVGEHIIGELLSHIQAVEAERDAARRNASALRGALRWIAEDSYKVVPSHWPNIAEAQQVCARQALAPGEGGGT